MYKIFFKPLLDCFCALGLFLLLWPVFLLIAILIKIESQGPVFFKQERLGKDGKVFQIFKFRTMVDNAIKVGSGLRTDENDPRITKIGNILRKTSLDELPQLFNILRGEMSFIGPRPPVPYHPYKYEDYDETQKKRFLVKPGVSGYAQIKVRNNATWDERIVYDVEYVERTGFWFDLYVLWQTVYVTVLRKNIYVSENKKKDVYSEPPDISHPASVITYFCLSEYCFDVGIIAGFIKKLDHEFVPPLVARGIDIDCYANKIHRRGDAVLALDHGKLVGLVTFYCNDMETQTAYLSWTGIDSDYRGRGISIHLISKCLEKCRNAGMRLLNVDTWDTHEKMIGIYQKHFDARIIGRETSPLRTVVHIQIEL